MLTSSDPEPPPCTLVRDACGIEWARDDEGSAQSWVRTQGDSGSDPEPWTKVAGNYGPVTVLEWGDGDRCSECGNLVQPGYRYSRCCAAPVVGEGAEETCEVHDVPMTDGLCSSCLADCAHDGR